MSNSASLLDLINASQAQKEVTANALLDAASTAITFGRRASTSTGLTFGVYGGVKDVGGVLTQIANQTVNLTASTTNYVLETLGVVSFVTVIPAGWPSSLAADAKALYEVVTGVSTVTSYTDWRTSGGGGNPLALLDLVNIFTKNQTVAPVALTDAASVVVDASLSNNFNLTLAGNRTIANPTGLTAGTVLNFNFTQDATGSRTLAFSSLYKFPGGIVPTLSTLPNSKDFMSCYYDGAVLKCNMTKGYA